MKRLICWTRILCNESHTWTTVTFSVSENVKFVSYVMNPQISTGSMHPAFSTNHLADIDKTKLNKTTSTNNTT